MFGDWSLLFAVFVNEVINTESFLRTELTWNLKEIIARSKDKGGGPLSDIESYEESLEAYQESEEKESIPDPQKKEMKYKILYFAKCSFQILI